MGILVLAALALRTQVETLGDRERIANRLRDLKARIEHDQNDISALNEIVEVLHGRWSFAQTYACGTLRELGPLARPALGDLIWALDCGNPFVEREAARALGDVSVGMPDAVPALMQKLRDEDDDAAWFAAESLGKIGRPAKPALSALERASRSDNQQMADSAKRALKRLEGTNSGR
jgi:HEAT repeat protein